MTFNLKEDLRQTTSSCGSSCAEKLALIKNLHAVHVGSQHQKTWSNRPASSCRSEKMFLKDLFQVLLGCSISKRISFSGQHVVQAEKWLGNASDSHNVLLPFHILLRCFHAYWLSCQHHILKHRQGFEQKLCITTSA